MVQAAPSSFSPDSAFVTVRRSALCQSCRYDLDKMERSLHQRTIEALKDPIVEHTSPPSFLTPLDSYGGGSPQHSMYSRGNTSRRPDHFTSYETKRQVAANNPLAMYSNVIPSVATTNSNKAATAPRVELGAWKVLQLPNGNVVYHNALTNRSQWNMPSELMSPTPF